MRYQLCVFFFLFSFISIAAAAGEQEHRLLYLKAEHALAHHDHRLFNTLLNQLQTYPLYPDLLYEDILSRLNTLPKQEVQQFLTAYPNTLLANKLQQHWFAELVKQGEYQAAIPFYKDSFGTAEQCQYAWAQWNNGKKLSSLIEKLWLVGHAQVVQCDLLFAEAKKTGMINTPLLWKRLNLAIASQDKSLSRHLINELPYQQRPMAAQLKKLFATPELLVTLTPSKDFQLEPLFLTTALIHLAKQNPQQALSAWKKWHTTAHFDQQQNQKIATAIGVSFSKKDTSELNSFIQSLNQNEVTQALLELQIRQALIAQDWPQVQKQIDKHSATLGVRPIWKYWYARSLEEQQQTKQAMAHYEELAKSRHYYGFLAAHRLNKPLPINASSLEVKAVDYQQLLNSSGIIRVKELFAVNHPEKANAQWWFTVRQLNDKQRYIAAKVAKDLHWEHLSLATSITSSHQDDLDLRFPMIHRTMIQDIAKKYHMHPALLFALIRQESFFKPSAISYVGARGLMQLMPKTAAYVAKLAHLNSPNTEELFDPKTNIHLGTAYLEKLFDKYNRQPLLAIASYNAGPNRVRQWLPKTQAMPADLWVETIPYIETRNYVKLVSTYMLIYQFVMAEPFAVDAYFSAINPAALQIAAVTI